MVWKDIDRKLGMALEDDLPTAAGRFSAGNGDYSGLVRGDTGHGDSSTSGSANGVYNSKGPGSILNQPVYDSQQRIKEASRRLKTEKDNPETRSIILNELREEQEFLKNLLGMQLELNTLGFKMAKAFAQALGQIVLQ
jgi:energy-coupling factor transporter ATP-binding protein EcfA2